jgi:hypothetical protein
MKGRKLNIWLTDEIFHMQILRQTEQLIIEVALVLNLNELDALKLPNLVGI